MSIGAVETVQKIIHSTTKPMRMNRTRRYSEVSSTKRSAALPSRPKKPPLGEPIRSAAPCLANDIVILPGLLLSGLAAAGQFRETLRIFQGIFQGFSET